MNLILPHDLDWQPFIGRQQIQSPLFNWLRYPGSLTEQLRQHFGDIQVIVLKDQLGHPHADERSFLSHPRLPCRIREVLLCDKHEPLIYAHSVIPLTPLLKKQQTLARLGNQPLGHWLFQQKNSERKNIYFKKINRLNPIFKAIPNKKLSSYWARRSWFQLNQEGLLVSEVFLCDMPQLRA